MLKEMILGAIEYNYAVADSLISKVDPSMMDWKPETGKNWLTVRQLLFHISNACGSSIKGFVTGDWGLPEGFDMETMTPEEMLPPAEAFPGVDSIDQARALLAEDKATALEMLAGVDEERLAGAMTPAPWDSMEFPLGVRMLQMVDHLKQHKGQLFYYLKLQGHEVNTGDLYGA